MHGFTAAIVDVKANDNAKLVEKQSCWQPLFYMTVISLFYIHWFPGDITYKKFFRNFRNFFNLLLAN